MMWSLQGGFHRGKFRRVSHLISKFHYWFLRIILKGKVFLHVEESTWHDQ